jgi:hypothetical protein
MQYHMCCFQLCTTRFVSETNEPVRRAKPQIIQLEMYSKWSTRLHCLHYNISMMFVDCLSAMKPVNVGVPVWQTILDSAGPS